MSRSGYCDDFDDHRELAMWRGAVASAIRGSRGQRFLKEMLAALDAMPEKKLIRDDLETNGAVCAIGAVGKARGVEMKGIDPKDREAVAGLFGIAPALAAEIVYMNDEHFEAYRETPEVRFARMRKWVEAQIKRDALTAEYGRALTGNNSI